MSFRESNKKRSITSVGGIKDRFIVGIDEVGRGPIAGPVCLCALIIEEKNRNILRGVRDSKKLGPKKREEWFLRIRGFQKVGLLNFYYKKSSNGVIDKKGIVFAINKTLEESLKKVNTKSKIFLDGGLRAPEKYKYQETIIKGDDKVDVISGASIVAKVLRDREMIRLSKTYKGYGFEKHKGYGTREHYKKIKEKGLSKIHRKSFLKNFLFDR
jgi:ribonuclease HII